MSIKFVYCLLFIWISVFKFFYNVAVFACDDGYVSTGTSCQECGLTYVTPNLRIIGGITANPYSWPSHALLIQDYKGFHILNGSSVFISKRFICGGTLINEYTVLTAARCISTSFQYNYAGVTFSINMSFVDNSFYSTLESTLTVYLGAHNISFLNLNINSTPPTTQYSIATIKIYPQYDPSSYLNDIAMLILSTRVIFNSFILPACLPSYSITYPNVYKTSYTVGWGTLSVADITMPILLNNVNLTIYDSNNCSSVYPTVSKNWNRQICAGELLGGRDICYGDSGGGLYILDTFGGKLRYMLTGIASYGFSCGLLLSPAIYTRVSYFTPWIKFYWKESDSKVTLPSIAATLTTPTLTNSTESNSVVTAVLTTLGVLLLMLIIAGVVVVAIILTKKHPKIEDTNLSIYRQQSSVCQNTSLTNDYINNSHDACNQSIVSAQSSTPVTIANESLQGSTFAIPSMTINASFSQINPSTPKQIKRDNLFKIVSNTITPVENGTDKNNLTNSRKSSPTEIEKKSNESNNLLFKPAFHSSSNNGHLLVNASSIENQTSIPHSISATSLDETIRRINQYEYIPRRRSHRRSRRYLKRRKIPNIETLTEEPEDFYENDESLNPNANHTPNESTVNASINTKEQLI